MAQIKFEKQFGKGVDPWYAKAERWAKKQKFPISFLLLGLIEYLKRQWINAKVYNTMKDVDRQVEEIKKDLTQGDLPIKDETPLKEVLKESSDIDEEKKEKAVMPSTELLDRALDDGSSLSESELNQIAELLEAKLEEFGIEATVESVLPGPVVTRFEIQPAPGTKASKITNIAQDIARSLSVSSVRVCRSD